MIRGLKLFAAFLLLGISCVAQAGQEPIDSSRAGSIDLLRLYHEAQVADPRVLAAHARMRMGQHRERESMSLLLPQLSADARVTQTYYRATTGSTDYMGERYGITLSQVLFDQQVWQSYQRFRAMAVQQSAEGEDRLQLAMLDVVQRYFEVLAAEDTLVLVDAEIDMLEQSLRRITSLYERQLVPITDKLGVAARLDRLLADRIESESRVEVTREGLAELVGRAVYEPFLPVDKEKILDLSIELHEYDHWRDKALASNQLLHSRSAAVDAQRAAQKEAAAGHLPRLTFSLSGQQTNIGYENAQSGRTESGVAAINLQLPLYSGGGVSARRNVAYEGMIVAQQELEEARREVLRETRTAFMNTRAALSRMHAASRALDSARQAREAAEKSFTFGINNIIDVLDRSREEFSASRDLLSAQYSLILSYTLLKRWSGDLSESDIHWINELLTGVDGSTQG